MSKKKRKKLETDATLKLERSGDSYITAQKNECTWRAEKKKLCILTAL